MYLLVILALLLIISPPVLAEPGEPSHLIHSDTTTTPVIVLQAKGWSIGYSAQESLSCDLATTRAKRQLANAITFAKAEQFVTAQDLMLATLRPAQRIWENGQCVIYLELSVPIQQKPLFSRVEHHPH